MEDLIKLLGKDLEYIKHNITDEFIEIHVKSNIEKDKSPYCGRISEKINSIYKKTKIIFYMKKFFCKNIKCFRKTFAEIIKFTSSTGTPTKRLDELINITC